MAHISQILKDKKIESKKVRTTEYSDLQDYFFNLDMTDRLGKKLSRGAIGFYLMPMMRGSLGNKDYSLLYLLKDKCEQSNCPKAVAWSYLKPKKK